MSYFDTFPKEILGILREHEILGISSCGKIYAREIYTVRLTSIEVTAWWKIYLDDELSNSKFRYLYFLKNLIVYNVVIAEF